jgi:transposase
MRTSMPNSDAATPVAVTVGGDTHVEQHVAVGLDPQGHRVGTRSFPPTAKGYAQLLSWARGLGDVEQVGIEGTGSYGAGLAR